MVRFNTVGDQEDFRYILQTIRSRYNQGHRFYGVGISAGSSLLARYLGGKLSNRHRPGGFHVLRWSMWWMCV